MRVRTAPHDHCTYYNTPAISVISPHLAIHMIIVIICIIPHTRLVFFVVIMRKCEPVCACRVCERDRQAAGDRVGDAAPRYYIILLL